MMNINYLQAPVKPLSVFIFSMVLFVLSCHSTANASDLYFPSPSDPWETVSPENIGIDPQKLQDILHYARQQQSSGLIILYKGRILTEHYWDLPLQKKEAYQRFRIDTTPDGRAIEDVASVQKSIVSFIAGMAREQGKLDIEMPVSNYIGTGWSRASLSQENNITVRHLLSMSSGLSSTLIFKAGAGSIWEYNTRAYSKLVPILEAATGMSISTLTQDWLTTPTGMNDSRWVSRQWIEDATDANRIGFASTARDLAKFGLLILAKGTWNGHAMIKTPRVLSEALEPSQDQNPDYGFLWWLNTRAQNPYLPDDAVWALGYLDRFVLIIPSRQLVCVRIGNKAEHHFRHTFSTLFAGALIF